MNDLVMEGLPQPVMVWRLLCQNFYKKHVAMNEKASKSMKKKSGKKPKY